MIKRNNKKLTAMSVIVGMALFTGCTNKVTAVKATTNTGMTTESNTNSNQESNIQVTYEEDDYYSKWDEEQATKITLGDDIKVDGVGAKAEGTKITITNGGTYVISGTLGDGQIIVDSLVKGTVRLVLNGANITSLDSAPIYVKQAGKVVVSLEEGTENILTDGKEYVLANDETEPDATLFSKDNLTINGKGKLEVNANYKDGIASKDSLKIVEGNITINAADDGIRGKDMIAIKDGNIAIKAVGDGIKSTNTKDANLGCVYIEKGEFNIEAEGDSIQAESYLEVLDGTFNIISGGGSVNGETHLESPMMEKGMGMIRPEDAGMVAPPNEGMIKPEDREMIAPPNEGVIRPEDREAIASPSAKTTNEAGQVINTTEDNTISKKGLKSGQVMIISGGTFNIDAADDAIHSNSEVVINGGKFSIATGDDAIHGETNLMINNGYIDITESYEGLEAENITVKGGEVYIVAGDDGINAAETNGTEDQQGDLMNPMGKAQLTIDGGYIYVDSKGDGLDANGTITMNGGTIIVDGPTNGGNGALDYDKTCDINGGIFIAAGSAQMAQSVSGTSKNNAINITFSTPQEVGQTVAILDKDGKAVISYTPKKAFQVIVISSPALETGNTYTYSYSGTVEGDEKNGLVTNATYTGGTAVTEFKISEAVTYLDESGVTSTANSSMMERFGKGQGGNRGPKKGSTLNFGNKQEQQEATTTK